MSKIGKVAFVTSFILVISLFASSVVFGQNWGSDQTVLYGLDSSGNIVPIEVESGALKSTAEISGDVQLNQASLAVVDDDGDTWNVRQSGSGNVYLTGTDVNVSTDTELKNLQDIVSRIEQVADTDGILVRDYSGSTIPVKLDNQDTDVVVTNQDTDVVVTNQDTDVVVTNQDTDVVVTNQDTDVQVINTVQIDKDGLATDTQLQTLIDTVDTTTEHGQDEIFQTSVSLTAGSTTAINFNNQSVKSWTLIPDGMDIHFTTDESNNTLTGSDMLLKSNRTWGETNRSAKQMELRVLADDSGGTVFIRARGK